MKVQTNSTVVHFFYLLLKRTNKKKFLELCSECGINDRVIDLTLKVTKDHLYIDKPDVTSVFYITPEEEEKENESIKVKSITSDD